MQFSIYVSTKVDCLPVFSSYKFWFGVDNNLVICLFVFVVIVVFVFVQTLCIALSSIAWWPDYIVLVKTNLHQDNSDKVMLVFFLFPSNMTIFNVKLPHYIPFCLINSRKHFVYCDILFSSCRKKFRLSLKYC